MNQTKAISDMKIIVQVAEEVGRLEEFIEMTRCVKSKGKGDDFTWLGILREMDNLKDSGKPRMRIAYEYTNYVRDFLNEKVKQDALVDLCNIIRTKHKNNHELMQYVELIDKK